MKKNDFIALVAEKAGLTKKDAEKSIDAVAAAIEEVLLQGDKVQVGGIGTFETRIRAARTCRNPKTKETVEVPETVVPNFKASSALKEKVGASR